VTDKAAFAGIYPPIATPFGDDGEVAVAGLKTNVEKWNRTGLDGLVVLGSNGEFPYLDDYERDKIVSTVMETAAPSLKIVVGTGRESTRATIRTTKRAAEFGAHAAIVVNPCYYTGQMTDAVLYEHYKTVADESPIPLFIYNVPGFTGVNLSVGLITRLAKHPNIAAVKDTSANIVQIADVVRQTPEDFVTLAGSASFLLASLAVGAKGGILAVANLAPEECVALYRAFREGNLAEARRLHQLLMPINAAVTTRFGAAGLKEAMARRGYYGGLPR
jgi:4-hydroxy-2-oxoglutarate aldolase